MLFQVLYTRDYSEGSSPSQIMLWHDLDQSFRNLMLRGFFVFFFLTFYLNRKMLLNVFIHSFAVYIHYWKVCRASTVFDGNIPWKNHQQCLFLSAKDYATPKSLRIRISRQRSADANAVASTTVTKLLFLEQYITYLG